MADIYSLSIRADTRDVTRAKQALDGLSSGATKATRTTQQLEAVTTRATGRAFKPMGNAIQQAGFQIGDFAVQVGSGQSALIAFAQQGSQLAGLFGPGGAVLGAVIAIGGAIAGGLVRSFGEGEDGARTLAEQISLLSGKLTEAKDGTILLSEEMRELAKVSADAARIELIVNAQEAKRAAITAANEVVQAFASVAGENPLIPDTIYSDRLGEVSDQLQITRQDAEALAAALPRAADRSQESYQRLLQVTADLAQKYGASSPQVLKLAEALQKTGVQAIQAIRTEEDLQAAVEETRKVFERSADAPDGEGTVYEFIQDEGEKARQKIEKMVEAIKAQADTIGLSARQTALYEAARLGANEADIQAINNAFDLIEAERQRMNLQKAMQDSGTVKPKDDPMLQRIEAQRRGMALVAEDSEHWAQRMEENQQQISASITDTMANVFGTLQTFTEEGSAEWAAMVIAQKGMMAAQAFMAANLAATLALASPTAGIAPQQAIAQAEIIRQIGYVNAGLILAQGVGEIAGARMHGGSVSAGGRYLVGEDGPEVVTMGGSGVVTPSSVMGTGEPSMPNITVNMIEDNARSGQVEQRRRDDGSVEVNAFVSDITSGGRRAKVMESVYGLRRQGR